MAFLEGFGPILAKRLNYSGHDGAARRYNRRKRTMTLHLNWKPKSTHSQDIPNEGFLF